MELGGDSSVGNFLSENVADGRENVILIEMNCN